MLLFNYRVTAAAADGITAAEGSFTLEGRERRVVCALPEGKLRYVTAVAPLHIEADEKIFMNGFQTWTYCPEYTAKDALRPCFPLPKAAVRKYALDRYGDYHFVDYPNRPGMTHGFSYCYFRRGERYRLIASLDERPGYTIFRYDANRGELSIERDCENVRCGGEFHAFDLFYAEGGENEVFDAWFEALHIRPRTEKKLAGYSSWYNRYQDINEKSILDDLAGCAEMLEPGDLFQIDDGWEPFVGDWLEPDAKKFPNGMKSAVEAIHAKGFEAGLWLAPFVAQEGSALQREHPDWLLLHDGAPWSDGCNWGGFYSLDIDNPAVLDYLERVFRRVFDEWGFDLVKLDFLYGAAPFGTESESRGGRMIRSMELLRTWCGEKKILGCGVPVMTAFGLVDYCRVSCDVSLDWDDKPHMRLIHRERVSTRHAIGNSVFRRQLNGRAYWSDPDVFFLREDNVKLTKRQKDMLAALDAVIGGVFLHSDDMSKYSEAAKAQYRALRHLREAKDVRVSTDGVWKLQCTIDGQPYEMVLENLP
ncbi:MAG: alpha-galactosidase [Ruminococcaceae bacterium]|nr:alpha-galactosidase [Oscillospiraceae bacterium]